MFRICNSDFFDFGAYPPPPFRPSSQIFPISHFDGFPYVDYKNKNVNKLGWSWATLEISFGPLNLE